MNFSHFDLEKICRCQKTAFKIVNTFEKHGWLFIPSAERIAWDGEDEVTPKQNCLRSEVGSQFMESKQCNRSSGAWITSWTLTTIFHQVFLDYGSTTPASHSWISAGAL